MVKGKLHRLDLAEGTRARGGLSTQCTPDLAVGEEGRVRCWRHCQCGRWLVLPERSLLDCVGPSSKSLMGRLAIVIERREWGDVTGCSGAFDYWGQGTLVTVTSAKLSKPSVFPLISCCAIEKSSLRSIGCLVTGFLPSPAEVTWSSGGPITTGIKTFLGTTEKSSSTQIMSSQLSVEDSDWQTKTYECTVNHKATSTMLKKELKSEACPKYKEVDPAVQVLLPSCKVTDDFDLTCLLTNYNPNNLNVRWLINGVQKTSPKSKFEALKASDGTFVGRSNFPVTKESWENGDAYTCNVVRAKGAELFPDMYNISRCSACLKGMPAPVVYLVRPSYQDISARKASVGCLVLSHDLHTADISWTIDGKAARSPQLEHIIQHSNSTVSRWSKLPVSQEDWKMVKTYTCKVTHSCLGEAKAELSTRVSKIQPTVPTVNLLIPSVQDPSDAESLTLFCDVTGFYPQDISIKWKTNKTVVVAETRYTNGPISASDSAFYTYSLLRVGKNEGGDYTCEVFHETLQSPKCETKYDVFAYKKATPHTYIIKPSFQELFKHKKSVITCLSEIRNTGLKWEVNGKLQTKDVVTDMFQNSIDGIWAKSTLHVTLSQWNTTKNLTCQPDHLSVVFPQQKFVRNLGTGQMKPPIISILPSLSEDVSTSELLTLVCLVNYFYPEDIFVTWDNGAKAGSHSPVNSAVQCNHSIQLCSMTSMMEVPHWEWLAGINYTCVVGHISSEQSVKKSINRHTGHQFPASLTNIIKPSFEELFRLKKSAFICRTEIRNASIKWDVNLEAQQAGVDLTQSRYSYSSTWTKSTLPVTLSQWNATKTLTCQPQYGSVAFPRHSIEVNSVTGPMKSPVIAFVSPLIDELSPELLTLVCLVKDFYPEGIIVAWENSTEMGLSSAIDGTAQCNHSIQVCSFTSLLFVPRAAWLAGATYICVVSHVSSEQSFKKSVSIQTGKPTIDDIPRDFSDAGGFDLSELDEAGSVWTTASTFIALFLLTLLYSSFVTFVKVK